MESWDFELHRRHWGVRAAMALSMSQSMNEEADQSRTLAVHCLINQSLNPRISLSSADACAILGVWVGVFVCALRNCSYVYCVFFISRHVVLYVLLLCHCMLFVHMCIACLLCTWEHCVTRDIRSHASEILCACICMCVRVCDLLILLLFTFLNVFITVLRSKVQL